MIQINFIFVPSDAIRPVDNVAVPEISVENRLQPFALAKIQRTDIMKPVDVIWVSNAEVVFLVAGGRRRRGSAGGDGLCRGVGMLMAPLQSVARGDHRVAVFELDEATVHRAAR